MSRFLPFPLAESTVLAALVSLISSQPPAPCLTQPHSQLTTAKMDASKKQGASQSQGSPADDKPQHMTTTRNNGVVLKKAKAQIAMKEAVKFCHERQLFARAALSVGKSENLG